ncbi:hypothetical protein [Erythrobacter sp. SG61-1L]|nr:hypothetical protein [Erythrobacter sp. SG61-1L]
MAGRSSSGRALPLSSYHMAQKAIARPAGQAVQATGAGDWGGDP